MNARKPQLPKLRLVSLITGRERWKSDQIYRHPRMAQEIQAIVSGNSGILSVEANPLTGGILVFYDPKVFGGQVETLLQVAHADLSKRKVLPSEPAQSLLSNPILRLLVRTDAANRELTTKAVVVTAGCAILFFFPGWGLSFILNIVTRRRGYPLLSRFGIRGQGTQIWLLGFGTIASGCAWAFLKHIQKKLWTRLAARAEAKIRSRAFEHVQQLDMVFFDNRSTGGLMHALSGDASSVGRFLEQAPGPAIEAATSGVVVLGSVFFTAPLLALPVCIPLLLFLLINRYVQKKIAPLYGEAAMKSGELSALLNNNLAGIATIKSFTAEEREARRVREMGERVRTSYERATLAGSVYTSVQMGLFMGVGNLSLIVGAASVLRGNLSMGSLMTLAQMIPILFSGVAQIDALFDMYQNASISAESVLNLLETKPTILDGKALLSRDKLHGEITYKDVFFGYQPELETLRALSLRVPAGRTVGIVGATGAGKSSLIKLLLRFYDLNSGSISIDGQSTRDLRIHNLRSNIGFVSQDIYLFDGTVHDNIAYGRPGASREEVEEAARAAEAHGFITQLPNGYDTITGERGQRLSAGQRQRISIARAVIKDAPILILDEATASVDNETEAGILRSIERLGADRSMIIIAHRLSTVRNADVIYVLDNKTVREQGTHEELVELNGLYASLWRVQTGSRSE
jgi:ATP-binding cassette subfamily B protein